MQTVLPRTNDLADIALAAAQQQVNNGARDRQTVFSDVVRFLVQEKECSLLTAKLHAANAIGDLDATKTNVRIDIAKTTPHCVFVNVDGELKALTVAEIERALSNSYTRL